MDTDWKDRLKEIGKELSKSHSEKKKESAASRPVLPERNSIKSVEDIFKDLQPMKSTHIESQSINSKEDISDKIPFVSHKISSPPSSTHGFNSPKTPTKTRSIPLPKQPSDGEERVTVGLDFGTSFTKVCLRRELGGDDVPIYPIVLEFDAYKKLATPLCPSLVAIKDNKIYFGQQAAIRSSEGARCFEHLKVCITCDFNDLSLDCVSSEVCPYRDGTSSPSILTSIYIAWVMKESRRQAQKILKIKQGSFIYNVGVPIKHLDWRKSDLHYKKYRRIFSDAWRISEGVSQGMDYQLALDWLNEVSKEQIYNQENSYVQIAPESSAAIVSYVNSAKSQTGLYSIVDIGAWTTDVSFFRLTDINMQEVGVPRLSFYAAEVLRKATNAIDEKIIHALMEYSGLNSIKKFLQNDLLSFIRSKREAGVLPGATVEFRTRNGTVSSIEIPNCIVDYSRFVITEGVRRGFTETFKEARKKEKPPDIWRNFTLFMTGGGSYEELFIEKICKKYEYFKPKVRSDILNFYTLEDNEDSKISKRLAVAAGLSYPLGMWPEQLHPTQVPDWEGPRMANIPDADDEPG
ncbi:MAG: hypothetical protein KBG04_07130 [Bacteroidales bacterium]|nr:hypothetical protein [Bacteroidales bacterium]